MAKIKNSFEAVVDTSFNKSIYKSWMGLWKNAVNANFYNSPMWFEIFIKSFGKREIKIVRFYENQKMVALTPLISDKRYFAKVFSTPLSNEPILMLKRDKDLLKKIFKYFANIDNIVLSELKDEFIIEAPFLKSYSAYTSDRPYINIEDAKNRLKTKSFKKIRSRLRNVGADLTYISKKPEYEDISKIAEIESRSYKVDTLSDIFSKESTRNLYKNFVDIAKDHIKVAFMNHGETPVVSDFYVIGRSEAHSTHTSYRKDYSNYWPGNLIQHRVLEDFFEDDQIKEIDLGRGINSLKLKFATDVRKYYTVFFVSNGVKRNLIMLLANLERKIHRTKESSKLLSALALKYRKCARMATLIIEEMKAFIKTPKDYIYLITYSHNEKVKIEDFDMKVKEKGQSLKKKIETTYNDIKVEFIGSTALELPGQNDIDLVIPCAPSNFEKYLPGLIKIFGNPKVKRDNFIEWTAKRGKISIDVLMIDQKSNRYRRMVKRFHLMKENSNLREAYGRFKEEIKGKSMREYEHKKLKFFNLVIGT